MITMIMMQQICCKNYENFICMYQTAQPSEFVMWSSIVLNMCLCLQSLILLVDRNFLAQKFVLRHSLDLQ